MRGPGLAAALLVCALAQAAEAQSCGFIGPTGRKMSVPAPWSSGADANYPDVWLFRIDEAGFAVDVVIQPQEAGTCQNLYSTDPDLVDSQRPVVFPQRFSRYWTHQVRGALHACRDWYGNHFIVIVGAEGSEMHDPRVQELTNAIADMFDYEMTCPGDPVVVSSGGGGGADGGVRPRIPWRGDFTVLLDVGHVFDAPPDVGQFAEASLSMVGRWSVFAVNPYGGGGVAFGGGGIFDVGFRVGLTFGNKKRVSVLGGAGIRGISGDRMPLTIRLGPRLELEWPLARKLQLLTALDLPWSAHSTEATTGKKTLSDFELSWGATAMVNRKRWLFGLGAEELGESLVVKGLVGLRLAFAE